LRKIHSSDPKSLIVSQKLFLSAILNACSSSNKFLSNAAGELLADYIADSSVLQVIPLLCTSALHEKDRLRVISLKVIVHHIPAVVAQSLTEAKRYVDFILVGSCSSIHNYFHEYIIRTIFPTLCNALLSYPLKPDIKIAATEALRALHREVFSTCDGVDIISWIEDSTKRAEIRKFLGK